MGHSSFFGGSLENLYNNRVTMNSSRFDIIVFPNTYLQEIKSEVKTRNAQQIFGHWNTGALNHVILSLLVWYLQFDGSAILLSCMNYRAA